MRWVVGVLRIDTMGGGSLLKLGRQGWSWPVGAPVWEGGALWCQGFTQHLGNAQLWSQGIWAQPGLGLNLSFPDV